MVAALAQAPSEAAPTLEQALDAARALGLSPQALPVPLHGGLLNYVWRLRTPTGGVILKQTPPFVAADPSIPLDPARQGFEAAALALLGEGGAAPIQGTSVRAPRLLGVDEVGRWLAMEDLGPAPHLGEALASGEDCAGAGAALGAFLGELHARSAGDRRLAARFNNASVQRARFAVQYGGAGASLEAAGVAAAGALGERIAALGRRLTQPGRCLIHGDLWPRSILRDVDGVGLIDWEFCHYGQPAQDLGHLAAHLRVAAHRAPSAAAAAEAAATLEAFLDAYRQVAGPLDEGQRVDCALHFAAELLIRSVGPFADSGPYAGLPSTHPARREILGVAVAHALAPEGVGTFAALG